MRFLRSSSIGFVCIYVFPVSCGCHSGTLPVDVCRINSFFLITSQILCCRVSPLECFQGVCRPPSSRSSSVCPQTAAPVQDGENTLGFGLSIKAASLLPGRVRTRRQSSGSTGGPSTPVMDSRGRSRAKVVSQSQRTCTHLTSVDTVSLRL